MIQEAHDVGASLYKACKTAGITVRTLQRWQTSDGAIKTDARPEAVRPMPGHTLSEVNRAEVLSIANELSFADQPPARIVAALAEEGLYVASKLTFYRILRAQGKMPTGAAPRRHKSAEARPHMWPAARARTGAGT